MINQNDVVYEDKDKVIYETDGWRIICTETDATWNVSRYDSYDDLY